MATINAIFPCKKLRRSSRLELKEKVEIKYKAIDHGQLGYFEIVPLELKFHVLSYLPSKYTSLYFSHFIYFTFLMFHFSLQLRHSVS